MKQVVSWGPFVEHHKGSSCHNTRKASVSCWFYQQVYHLALSTREIHNQLPKKLKKGGKTMCEAKAVTLICSHKQLSEDILSSGAVEYIAIWIIVWKTKQPHCTCFTAVTSRDCYLFSQKGKKMPRCQAYLTVSHDPNSWKEKLGNVFADQRMLDFDETKWAHHEI